jgi:hypothetical protein
MLFSTYVPGFASLEKIVGSIDQQKGEYKIVEILSFYFYRKRYVLSIVAFQTM